MDTDALAGRRVQPLSQREGLCEPETAGTECVMGKRKLENEKRPPSEPSRSNGDGKAELARMRFLSRKKKRSECK